MPKEPKIKQKKVFKNLFDKIYQLGHASLSTEGLHQFRTAICQTQRYIKSIQKDRKWLKKERERLLYCKHHYERMILSDSALRAAENMINSMPVPDGLERVVNPWHKPNLPVAEFKCAKTNKPTGTCKHYLCILEYEGSLSYEYVWYDSPSFRLNNSGKSVIAFTETEPGEIVRNLK